ncbi:MAG: N-acetyltransferase [Myxococcales bacterium]|nr:N-acetyltransferase [Myxococcales bacterium]
MKTQPEVTIREERPEDIPAIHALQLAAFGQPDEAVLVDALRAGGGVILSLVAVAGDEVVGHVLFSPIEIVSDGGGALRGATGLAPMGVLPAWQGRGVGGALVREGLERLRALGRRGVVLVGHPGYYPRFGFQPASRLGLRWEHEVPDAAFMAIELREGGLGGGPGVVRFRPEFDAVN